MLSYKDSDTLHHGSGLSAARNRNDRADPIFKLCRFLLFLDLISSRIFHLLGVFDSVYSHLYPEIH